MSGFLIGFGMGLAFGLLLLVVYACAVAAGQADRRSRQ